MLVRVAAFLDMRSRVEWGKQHQMAESRKAIRHGSTNDEKAESVNRTVTLATNSLDGQELTDEELDDLCDATLSEARLLPPEQVGRINKVR